MDCFNGIEGQKEDKSKLEEIEHIPSSKTLYVDLWMDIDRLTIICTYIPSGKHSHLEHFLFFHRHSSNG